TPWAGFNGTDTFTYRVHDGKQSSELALVTIEVSPLNDVPVAVDDLYEVDEDTQLVVEAGNGVLANDYDLDGDVLEAVLINQPLNGSVVLNSDGSFVYTPRENYYG